jgi:hypothetical protein
VGWLSVGLPSVGWLSVGWLSVGLPSAARAGAWPLVAAQMCAV